MRNHEQHPSDDELLLAAEVESGRRAHRVRSHLGTCAICRSRVEQMESVLIDFRRAERSSLDPELPSIAGPRAALQIRLAKPQGGRAGFFSLDRIFAASPAMALGVATLAAVMVVAGVLVLRHFSSAGAEQTAISADPGVLPNRAFTPGAARRASLARVCSLPHEEVVKSVPPQLRQRVFAEYGIPLAQAKRYEVDYLITPGLGGEDNIRNLWPEPYNAGTWNAHTKDILEERLHQMVCSHQLNLSAAQKAISTNWIAAYERYVQGDPSHTRRLKAPFLPQSVSAIVFFEDAESYRTLRSAWRLRSDHLRSSCADTVAGASDPPAAEKPMDPLRLI